MNHPETTSTTRPHDHSDCVQSALRTAEQLCQRRGLRFTPTRRRVLELVWDSHKPIGAYDILGALGREFASAAPPTVYRALDFLIEAGLVHRLDSLNAFVGCPDPVNRHAGQFLICTCCRTVSELSDPEIEQLIAGKAAAGGFVAMRQVLEIEGLCNQCRTAPQSA